MVPSAVLVAGGRRLRGLAIEAPDPMVLHPVTGQQLVVLLKPLVRHPNVEVGEYSYYDDPMIRWRPSATRCCMHMGPSG
jgi:virginiamycin A acetyltransferase